MVDLNFALAHHAATFPSTSVSEASRAHVAVDLLDGLAAALGGFSAPGVAETRGVIEAMAGRGEALVFGTAHAWAPAMAAMANATAGHALDFDDTLDEGGGMHAGVPVHMGTLAVADALGNVSGEEYVAAVAVGLDIAVRLALAPTQDFGWHRTSAFGVFGVAVAVGRLLHLSEEQMRNALAIAYSQASGNRQCIADGALSKRLQAGFAARDGITAAYLAQAGLTGAENAFEGRDGFFPLYQRGAFVRETVTDGLGEELLNTRISIKPYSCGRNLHGLVDSALDIRESHGADGIERIVVTVPERGLATLRREFPTHVVEAQFSPGFAVAMALVQGETPLAQFADPAGVSPAVRALFARVEVGGGEDAATNPVEVHYSDGRTARVASPVARGNPQRPLTPAQVEAKFLECAAYGRSGFDDATAREIAARAQGVASLASTRELTSLLVRP